MILQQAVIKLDVAFPTFLIRRWKRFRAFKHKHGKQLSYHHVGINVLDNVINIPKSAPVEVRLLRKLHGNLKSITVTRSAMDNFIRCYSEMMVWKRARPLLISRVTAMAIGLSHYAIMSDGAKVDNPRYLNNASCNLRCKQKTLSRKQRGSANRKKARICLAALQERVANACVDF